MAHVVFKIILIWGGVKNNDLNTIPCLCKVFLICASSKTAVPVTLLLSVTYYGASFDHYTILKNGDQFCIIFYEDKLAHCQLALIASFYSMSHLQLRYIYIYIYKLIRPYSFVFRRFCICAKRRYIVVALLAVSRKFVTFSQSTFRAFQHNSCA